MIHYGVRNWSFHTTINRLTTGKSLTSFSFDGYDFFSFILFYGFLGGRRGCTSVCRCAAGMKPDDFGVVSCSVILSVLPLSQGPSLNTAGSTGSWEWEFRLHSCACSCPVNHPPASVFMLLIVTNVLWFGIFKIMSQVAQTDLCWDSRASCFCLLRRFHIWSQASSHSCSSTEIISSWQNQPWKWVIYWGTMPDSLGLRMGEL